MFLTSLASWHTGVNLFAGGRPSDPVQSAISLAFGVTIIAVPVTLFAAIPAVLALSRRSPVNLGSLLLAGAALGNLPFAVLVGAVGAHHFATGEASSVSTAWYGGSGAARCLWLGTICGTASAAVFWIVAIRRTGTQANPTTSGHASSQSH